MKTQRAFLIVFLTITSASAKTAVEFRHVFDRSVADYWKTPGVSLLEFFPKGNVDEKEENSYPIILYLGGSHPLSYANEDLPVLDTVAGMGVTILIPKEQTAQPTPFRSRELADRVSKAVSAWFGEHRSRAEISHLVLYGQGSGSRIAAGLMEISTRDFMPSAVMLEGISSSGEDQDRYLFDGEPSSSNELWPYLTVVGSETDSLAYEAYSKIPADAAQFWVESNKSGLQDRLLMLAFSGTEQDLLVERNWSERMYGKRRKLVKEGRGKLEFKTSAQIESSR